MIPRFLTTSDIFSSWVNKDLRAAGPVAQMDRKSEAGDTTPLYSTGKLEEALDLGLRVVVVSSRPGAHDHDQWWIKLVGEEHVHWLKDYAYRDRDDIRNFYISVAGQYGINWPTRISRSGERTPVDWRTGLLMINRISDMELLALQNVQTQENR